MSEQTFDFEETKIICMGREQHRCLKCGLYLRAGQWPGYSCHHRANRRTADPQWRHSPANCVELCGTGTTGCHGWAHQHPEEANRLGYHLTWGQDPHTTPILDWRGRWLLLDDEGQYETTSKPKGQ